MAITDFFMFENPGVVAFVLGLFVFVVFFSIFAKMRPDMRGTWLVVSLAIGVISGWYLYANDFFGWGEKAVAILLFLVVALIILRAMWAFVRGSGRRWG